MKKHNHKSENTSSTKFKKTLCLTNISKLIAGSHRVGSDSLYDKWTKACDVDIYTN